MDNEIKKNGINAATYEAIIKRLRGVLSARVILNKEGGFEEIHVLANTERSPKVIVRDIETAIMVNFNITIDHKVISVVQMAEDNMNFIPIGPRLRLANISTSVSRSKVEVTVSITENTKSIEGMASGLNSPANRLRLIAAGALDALNKIFETQVTFAVDDIAKMNFAGREVIVVSVFMVTQENEDLLLGAAFVKGDVQEAVGKAALNAVNRKCALLKRKQDNL